jgi:PAS domain-containing protein
MAPPPEGGYVTMATDITERKRAEEALRASETLLHTVLEAIEYRVIVLDSDLRIRMTNRAYRDFLNFPEGFFVNSPSFREDMEFTRKHRYYAIPDDEWDDYLEGRLEAIRNGDLAPVEVHYAEGSVFYRQCIPLPDGGRVLTYFDITERKRAEEELAKKEAQLRIALENMPSGLALNDGSLVYTVVNQQARDLLELPDDLMTPGGSVEEVVRYSAARGDYGPGQVDELANQRLTAVREGKQLTLEVQMPCGR